MPAQRTRAALDVCANPPAPALHIVAPTPRAFTFPSAHNLPDSPYATPSASPAPAPAPAPLPSLSSSQPPTTPAAMVAAAAAHRRRKSSASTDAPERRPKKGDDDYIKRPENAFILFRRKCCEDRQALADEAASAAAAAAADNTPAAAAKKQRQADLSKTISQQWKGLPAAERQMWEDLARDKKREHEKLYPHYVYRPQRARDKDGRARVGKKASLSAASGSPSAATATNASPTQGPTQGKYSFDDGETVSFVVPLPRAHGQRSASAPTPPPYQSIQIPNVYHMTPSCPTSPSLLPMISRRAAHPAHAHAAQADNGFDYVPNPAYVAPGAYSMASQSQFEATLQSSEFLRNIFGTTAPANSARYTPLSGTAALLLPSPHIVSPASSASSSSGPPSPASGPFTPSAAEPLFGLGAGMGMGMGMGYGGAAAWGAYGSAQQQQQQGEDGTGAGAGSVHDEAQREMDMQAEMQMQAEFAAFAWGSSSTANGNGNGNGNDNGEHEVQPHESLWGNEPAVLMTDDFDINAIPPLDIGLAGLGMGLAHGGGKWDAGEYHDFGANSGAYAGGGVGEDEGGALGMGLIGFDEMMAGHGF